MCLFGFPPPQLDVLSNDIFVSALVNSGACAVLVSEENEEPILVPPNKQGRFCVAFDPLDGSSNIDCNVSTGTIFAVYEKTTDGPGKVEDILRTGNDIVAAGCAHLRRRARRAPLATMGPVWA